MSRILIVEDEEKIARFTELELMHEGYEVDKVADGRTGVEAALERDYDLILLDIMLPELNGLEVLRRIRKVKQTPIILLTARGEVMDKVAGLDGGADDYITSRLPSRNCWRASAWHSNAQLWPARLQQQKPVLPRAKAQRTGSTTSFKSAPSHSTRKHAKFALLANPLPSPLANSTCCTRS